MLSIMRNQKKVLSIFLWLVIAAFLGTIFLVWGVGDKVQNSNYVAKVNDAVISYDQYRKKYDETVASLRQLLGDQAETLLDNAVLERKVVEDLITQELLNQEAAKTGVPVSDAEVASEITNTESFQVNGAFDPNRYSEVLNYFRLTPQQYEDAIRRTIRIAKLTALIKGAVNVSDAELMQEYNFRGTKAVASYVSINPASYASKVVVNDANLKAYYDKNKENYRTPQKITVKYTYFAPSQLDNKSVSQQEVEQYFIANKDSFATKEAVSARHILVRVADWNNEKLSYDAFNKIKKAQIDAKAGKDFAALAKQYSDDPSAAQGGDLGSFTKGQMVPEFEAAAFALPVNGLSDIVKTQFGYHLIQVYAKTAAKNPTMNDVRDEIVKKIVAERSKSEMNNRVMTIYRDILTASNLTAFNEKNPGKLVMDQFGPFTMADSIPLLDTKPEIKSSLFRLQKTEVSQVVELAGNYYIFEIADRVESAIPPMDAVKAAVTEAYIKAESVNLAVKDAEAKVKGKDLNAAAATLGAAVAATEPFLRTVPASRFAGQEQLIKDIFGAKAGATLQKAYTGTDGVFLVRVDSLTKPEAAGFATEKDAIRKALLDTKQSAAFNSYVWSLREKAEVTINPAFIKDQETTPEK